MKGKKRSRFAMIWRRFLKNRLAVVGLVILLVMVLLCTFAGIIVDEHEYVVKQDPIHRLQSASAQHIFGTDSYGRDIFGRILFGGRISLSIGVAVVALALLLGGFIGAVAGYYGGKVDMILMRIMDILLAIPSMVLALAIVAALGTNVVNLMISLAIARTPQMARVVRAAILPVKEADYIEAARACGTSNARIILKHVFPNAFGPIMVQATMQIGTAIMNISSLSFIGLGIQPPTPEWGSMLSEMREYLRYQPTLVLAPGICIMLAVFAFNRIGDGLRDALDPRLKN